MLITMILVVKTIKLINIMIWMIVLINVKRKVNLEIKIKKGGRKLLINLEEE